MAPPEKKYKEPMKTVRQSKVKKTTSQRATQKKKFSKSEIFLYHAIKNGGAKFDHEAVGKALGKSKDAARMQMSRLLNDIGDFIKNQEDFVQSDQPEHEKTPANQEGSSNATQDGDTPVKTSDMEDI